MPESKGVLQPIRITLDIWVSQGDGWKGSSHDYSVYGTAVPRKGELLQVIDHSTTIFPRFRVIDVSHLYSQIDAELIVYSIALLVESCREESDFVESLG